MPYKLVAIDVDGTLINEKRMIPLENIKTIRTLREKGIKFVIATGRNDSLVREYVDILNIKAPVIGCNGATTRDVINNKMLALHTIPNKSLIKVYEYLDKNNYRGRLFDTESLYINNKEEFNDENNIYFEFHNYLKEHMNVQYVDQMKDIIKDGLEPLKVVFVNEDPKIISEVQKQLKTINKIEVVRSARNCLDIVGENVSKGNALKDYTESIGIKPSEVVAIGDSENDHSMLTFAGFSVTLENGEDSLKEIVNMVTDTNNNAGVSKALNKIFNLC